jgi:predicted CoA-binding protein
LDDGTVLVSRPIDALPAGVGIVCTLRPPEQQAEIARAAIALGARVLWIEPGEGTSEEARDIAVAAGLQFVEGESIAAAVTRLGIVRR